MTTMLNTLINGYDEIAATGNYIFGYADRHIIYVSFANASLLPYICMVDKASRGGGYSLRFKPNKEQKELLKIQNGTFILCSEDFFESEVKNSIYNRGEIFEKMITEHFGQTWEKDKVPFTEDGDLTVDDTVYQIKYQKATFCSEKSLANLRKALDK